MAQQGLWFLAREKCCKTEERCPRKKSDFIREYQAMHEQKILEQLVEGNGEDKKEEK